MDNNFNNNDLMLNMQKAQALKDAKSALTMAIFGFFCFGVILGPMAISKGNKVKAMSQPTDEAYSKANTAVILGYIVLALWAIGIIIQLISYASY